VYAKRRIGDVSMAQEILHVQLRQSYYTDQRAALTDPSYSSSYIAPSNFSPISLSARTMPTSNISGTVQAEIDSSAYELRTLSADANYNWRSGSLRAGWSQDFFIATVRGFDNPDFLRRALTAVANVRTDENRLGGTYSLVFDAAKGDMQQQTFSGYYNAQCCGIAIQYQRYNYGSSLAPIPFDRRFFISFSLAGLGSFSPFNGALGGLPR
jgi:hypothetical protein